MVMGLPSSTWSGANAHVCVRRGQARDRKRTVLVQAVSLLRQRKLDEVVKSLNNLLAANRVRGCGFFAMASASKISAHEQLEPLLHYHQKACHVLAVSLFLRIYIFCSKVAILGLRVM